jgi:hypothetical protein
LFYSKETERIERSRNERGGLHRLATEDFMPDIKSSPSFDRETAASEGCVIAGKLEEQWRGRRRGMEDCRVSLFPDMPTAEEDESWGSFWSDRKRHREEVEVSDVSITGNGDSEGGPERGDCRAVEGHVAGRFELLGAQRTARFINGDNALAEEDIARVHPGLHEEPGEEPHTGGRTAALDESRVRRGDAVETAEPIEVARKQLVLGAATMNQTPLVSICGQGDPGDRVLEGGQLALTGSSHSRHKDVDDATAKSISDRHL